VLCIEDLLALELFQILPQQRLQWMKSYSHLDCGVQQSIDIHEGIENVEIETLASNF
jgi:hypothetical protein